MSGEDAAYAALFGFLIIASQLDRFGFFSDNSQASQTAHHAARAAAASPTPIPTGISPEDASWLVSWPALVLVLLLTGIVIVVVLHYIIGNMKEENEKCHETLEGRLNRHDERIEDQYWIENRLKQQSEDIRTLTAELHTHRKMLKVLKQMPDYQIAAATVAVSAAVTDPKAAREMSQEIKVSAKNEPAWEQESEVNDEN